MLIYHEAPFYLFDEVQRVTDGDYALVHLFGDYPCYYGQFEAALKSGRRVILDNSLYELGTRFDGEEFAYWVAKLKPTYYIVPDVWKDSRGTLESLREWIDAPYTRELRGLRVGVAQGYGVDDTAECYRGLEPYCNMIAFNFDYSRYFYEQYPDLSQVVTSSVAKGIGRYMLLKELDSRNVIDRTKEHHLLGCSTLQEVSFYKEFPWITSIDTSNPVIQGIFNGLYQEDTIAGRLPYKVADHLMMWNIPQERRQAVLDNIEVFRKYAERGLV